MVEWIGHDGIIVGVVLTVAGSVAALNKFGFISFGRQKGCPDPDCSGKVSETAKNFEEFKTDFKTYKVAMYKKTDETRDLVKELDGFIRGRLGE